MKLDFLHAAQDDGASRSFMSPVRFASSSLTSAAAHPAILLVPVVQPLETALLVDGLGMRAEPATQVKEEARAAGRGTWSGWLRLHSESGTL